jgi:hypothetical protein
MRDACPNAKRIFQALNDASAHEIAELQHIKTYPRLGYGCRGASFCILGGLQAGGFAPTLLQKPETGKVETAARD